MNEERQGENVDLVVDEGLDPVVQEAPSMARLQTMADMATYERKLKAHFIRRRLIERGEA